ncbi:hypothetical protein AL073_13230 [Loktanella sp. 1ANDIMAR09]|uniref:Cation/multidrug efflux pump n=1 Tax=Yoonia rosea TaxID=287098 RepID=A0A1R3XHD8_9RHOB|nr:hypothetical protein [Yoonia rosea]KQB96192.1 hypothetical protein AL073_13230 [Loktanella sp. 1ANDIMAR09]SIT90825.1 hypothetical protein SAMN05421665_3241 [Yoonia rosea]
MGFIKLVVFGFIGLTVIYFSVSLYSRSVRKERLEDEFDAENPDGDREARDAFVTAGLKAYDASIRPKLIGLVYVVPTLAIGAIVYMINAN